MPTSKRYEVIPDDPHFYREDLGITQNTQLAVAGGPILSVEILGLPSVNTHYNKHYKTRATHTKRIRENAENMALLEMWDMHKTKPYLRRALVIVNVFVPHEGIMDIHNVHIKPVLDGFSDAGVWMDDEWAFVPLVLFQFAGIGTELELKKRRKRQTRVRRTVFEVYELQRYDKMGHRVRLPLGRKWL